MISSKRRVDVTILALVAMQLLALPLVTTFDDLLAGGLMRTGLTGPLGAVAAVEARLATALLSVVGLHAGVDGSSIVLAGPGGQPQALWISWNCVGWQSLVLLAISLAVGLRGGFGWEARLQVVLTGILGTILVNLLRVAAVGALAASVGRDPAVLFHDYGGTLLVIAWLFAFWALAHRWLLVAGEDEP